MRDLQGVWKHGRYTRGMTGEKAMVVALLTAAGIGSRMGQDIPKQFIHVDNKPIIIYTMEAFERHPAVDAMMVVTLPAWTEVLRVYARQFRITKLRWVVGGGETGQDSIGNGLAELGGHLSDTDIVLIHDGNRCMVSGEVISDSLATYYERGSAVAAIPCVEAVFRSGDGGVSSTCAISREALYRTQTPHTYPLGKLLWSHGRARELGITNTVATCTLMRQLGERIYFSRGSEQNIKITTLEDVAIFEALLHTKRESG